MALSNGLSSRTSIALIITTSCLAAVTQGYDASMMNGLNLLPSYTDYFQLNAATLGLNTAAIWIGGTLATFPFGPIMDKWGRKPGLYIVSALTIFATILQGASQNVAMFAIARILIGFAIAGVALICPAYVAETLPPTWRSTGLGILNSIFYVGGLIAAAVTYGTAHMQSTWAWRIPSLMQGVFAIASIAILPFIPESPRFLQSKGRTEEAIRSLAVITSNGDINALSVVEQHEEIKLTLEWEKNQHVMSAKHILKQPSLRKRLNLTISVALIVALSGNNIVSYYFGTMLTQAGITSTDTQLVINVVLNVFCLFAAPAGTFLADKMGRKPLALASCVSQTVFLFIVGALTKEFGTTDNKNGIYATVAMIFLFQGAYSFAWTPLATMYPPEVLNYSLRALGMSIYTFCFYGSGLAVTFVFPTALDTIGWKLYMINGGWDILQTVFVAWYWVETKGLTLEGIDRVFDGDRKPLTEAEMYTKKVDDAEVSKVDIETREKV
ncbi:hexose transporter [Trichoderma velutinum]